jgi:polysaccharide pyruvyl transferase WcaK-like protein
MNQPRCTTTIALLTPYCGSNLGDGAIQHAVVHNIRARCPEVRVVGLTLDPQDTARLHDIPSYPIAAAPVPYYMPVPALPSGPKSPSEPASDDPIGASRPSTNPAPSLLQRMKSGLARIPFLFAALKYLYHTTAAITADGRHWISSWRLMRSLDVVIASGGGQIDDEWGGPWGHPYALFKWAILARIRGKPFYIISVGVCTLRSRISRFFVTRALRLSAYRSFRDTRSQMLVEQLGVRSKNPVAPDLAFSFPFQDYRPLPVERRGGLVVGVSPISYLNPEYWPSTDGEFFQRYVTTLVAFVNHLLESGHQVILFSTTHSDARVTELIRRHLTADLPLVPSPRILQPTVSTVHDLIPVLAAADVVVASRLHGVLLSYLLCRPVLGISYDVKVNLLMNDLDQTQYCLDIHSLATRQLEQTFNRLCEDKDNIRRALQQSVALYRDRLSAQYDHVLRNYGMTVTPERAEANLKICSSNLQ